jgi:hypothetical protein
MGDRLGAGIILQLSFSQEYSRTPILGEIEDDLNFWGNGRQPQFLGKWKTTSIFGEMEDDLYFFIKMEDDLNFLKMEDDLNFLKNGRPQFYFAACFSECRPQFLRKRKTASIFGEMEDDLNVWGNGRRPIFLL